MTTTCYYIIEDAIQDLLQGHTNTTIDAVDQDGPISEYQRLKVESYALESQIRVLRDAKRATDIACDLEPLGRSQNTIESPRDRALSVRRSTERFLSNYWRYDWLVPAGEPSPRILEWTEKTIESVIGTLTQEPAHETCKGTELEFNLPWNSPVVTGPIIVRDLLQDRLSPLEKQLADLRWRQNTLIPIARILPELLIDIFELVLDAADSFDRDDTNLVLVVLTRICRDWTRLIFNTPCLWSRISPKLSPFKHVGVALARSKHGPLRVHFRAWQVSHIGPGHFLGAIKRHADRLKVLDLELDSPRSIDALNALFVKVLPPRLETLRVSLRIGGSATTWPVISFFKGPWHDTLQHLQLEGVRLPTGGYGELRGLRSLLLTPTISPFLLNTAEILRALSNCPNLENLSINSLTEPGGELSVWTGNRVTPVRLDRLRRITLQLPPASLRAVLGSILPTKLDRVTIETTMPRENNLAWTDVLLTNDIQPFVQTMNTLLQSTSQITIHVDGPKVALWTPSQYETPYVRLQFTGDRLAEVGRWMAKCLDLGPVEVEVYILRGSTSWMDTIPFIISKFHNIVRLHLGGAESVSQRAIEFLSTPLYADSAAFQHFPVPRLAHLDAQVHEPTSIISMLERRYTRHGSTDVTNTGHPVARCRIVLKTAVELSSPILQPLTAALPGCEVWVAH